MRRTAVRTPKGDRMDAKDAVPAHRASRSLSAARLTRRSAGVIRSTSRIPSRWSISCWSTRAKRSSASTATGFPSGIVASIRIQAARRIRARMPGKLRHPSSPSAAPRRAVMRGSMNARSSSGWPVRFTTRRRRGRPTWGAARPMPPCSRMKAVIWRTVSTISGVGVPTGWDGSRRAGWGYRRISMRHGLRGMSPRSTTAPPRDPNVPKTRRGCQRFLDCPLPPPYNRPFNPEPDPRRRDP